MKLDSEPQQTFGAKQNPDRKEQSEPEEGPEENYKPKSEVVQSLENAPSGYLIVSLDDGIIRLIEEINAI